MRAGMQPLLTLLRGEPLDGISEQEWTAALDLAGRENLLPWIAARLTAAGSWGPQLTERLRQVRHNARISAFLWTARLRAMLAEFHGRGIPVVSLKGPWLAERLYGDAALRNYSDLDLLVRRSDLTQAEDLLSESGFEPAPWSDNYERSWRRGSILIDLHHDVENPLAFDFRIAEVWRRCRHAEFHGVPARLLGSADERLFLCLHSMRHHFERLSLILDLVFMFRCMPQTDARRNPAADHLVAIGARMAARLDPGLAIPDPSSLRKCDRQALDVLADQVWEERLRAPAPALDLCAQRNLYVALETRPTRRARMRFRLLLIRVMRIRGADISFAARFHLRRTWQVRLLRPFRLLLKAARSSASRLTMPSSAATRTAISTRIERT